MKRRVLVEQLGVTRLKTRCVRMFGCTKVSHQVNAYPLTTTMVALSTLSQLSKLSSASPASSKSLVSFFGVLVAATELVVVGLFKAGSSSSDASKGGFRGATHTIPVVYKPTQCLPSSDAMVAPSFLFYGPFIVMLVSAVCTLGCVTGTGTSPPAPPTPQDPQNTQHIVQTPSSNSLLYDGQPPPPPPIDPGSETDGKLPRPRSFWWMIFLFILVGVPAFLLRFHFPISGTDMSSVASTYVSSRLAQLAALVKPYIPEIRWVQYIPEIPCAQIATHMAIVSLSSGLFCVVICIGIQLGRKGLYYLQSLSLSPNPPDWLCYIGVSSFLPILMLFLCCGILDLCFNFQLFALFHEGFILATTKECLDPVVAALLRILSPSDISVSTCLWNQFRS